MRPTLPLDVLHCPLEGINLIEASAGTGKTWTICGLYLRLLLERDLTVQQILVVTFTNAATAELRERIRTRIVELAQYLAREPGSAQTAIDRLNRALQTFDEASIFTIHGFCQRALADNPFSAGLPMRSELVEDDQDLLMEAINDFWRRHVAAESVSPAFARFLNTNRDSPETYARLLRRHLSKPLARHLWPAEIEEPSIDTAVLDQPYQRMRATWGADHNAIVGLVLASMTALHASTYKDAVVRNGARAWETLCAHDDPLAELGEDARLYRASVLEAKTKKRCAAPTHAFFVQAEAYLGLRERVEASLRLARLRLLRRLFEEAGSQLRNLKRSRQVVSFDDMLSNVHERLTNPDFPWLAGSIKSRFPAALIDEFQDTDPLQFEIFRLIYGGAQGTVDPTVFVVGDPKQAIYSFRHADLHTYLRAKRWASKQWSLADNQRSSEALLEAQNALFQSNPSAFILSDIAYRRVGLGEKRRSTFTDRTEPRAPLTVWRLPQEGGAPLPKNNAKSAAVEAVCAEIARLIDAGSRGEITHGGQPLRPRDIAVLVRARSLGDEIKHALANLGVGAAELARSSVFQAADAEDLETVLRAILSASRESLVRAALATDLFGCDAGEIEALSGGAGLSGGAAQSRSEALLMARMRDFSGYRALWFDQGFGVMYRRLLAEQAVARRMLLREDGERRLTNFLHLGENLQRAAETHGAPDALLRHLKSLRDNEISTEAAQLRLESDRNLVQIVTVHACKGLEFPVVFCPFLCDGGTRAGGITLPGLEYHDTELEPVIDFREYDKTSAEFAPIKAILQSERAAETVRLLYVALTRAVHRCYLVAGTYACGRSIKESTDSMLNWLVTGQGKTLEAFFSTRRTPAEIDAAWESFARRSARAVAWLPLPQRAGTRVAGSPTDAAMLSTPAAPGLISGGWRLSSYSGLTHGARSEQAAGDHDARADAARGVPLLGGGIEAAAIAADDILRFPRGPSAGECVHAVFESVDFTDPDTWERSIGAALLDHPQMLVGYTKDAQQQSLAGMLKNLVNDVTVATLVPGLRLAAIPWERRLTELEFTFPAPHLSLADLNATLESLGYDVPTLAGGNLKGYLKGFIDLVFEYQGRFFILDWKSNHLGYQATDYAADKLAAAMAEHGYHLQYLIYIVALDRYLRLRVENYDYETHFGGVLYLFVRGVRAAWGQADGTTPGVYFHRPSGDAVRRLNQAFDSSDQFSSTLK